MVKASETTENERPADNKSGIVSGIVKFSAVVILIGTALGIGTVFYQHRDAFFKSEPEVSPTDQKITRLENTISTLQNRLAELERDNAGKISGREISALNERIETQARLNREILDSKAGTNTVLGLISRLDTLENRVNNMGRVTSTGALVLTASMMVKDIASSGKPFEYEAEILRQLAVGTDMETPANTIAGYASEGLPNDKSLIASFNALYETLHTVEEIEEKAEMPTEPQDENWKEKINRKLSRLVTIKYHNKNGEVVEKAIAEDEVYVLVNDGQFDRAVLKMIENPIYQTAEFQNWQNKVRARDEFSKALRRIQALTLASMKVETLKTTEE